MADTKRLAYLGPAGTFSEQAALIWRQKQGEGDLLPVATIPEAIFAVVRGQAASAVVPVENSIEGAVNLTMDLLAEENLFVQGEIVLKVSHDLLGRPEALVDPQIIYSHPQALAQCRKYLEAKFPGVPVAAAESTAAACRRAAAEQNALALGSSYAARAYNLEILEQAVQDYPDNKTRFVAVGTSEAAPTGDDKTSLVLALPQNRPGGLYRVLQVFAEHEVNLTRIESRPAKAELGEYLFFLDCEGHYQREPLAGVLQELGRNTVLLKVLGSYPIRREV